MKPRARIYYDPPHTRGLRWYRHAGYRWECSCSPRARGRNSFDRFTDRVKTQPYVHPWQRCMNAVERHFWTHHSMVECRKVGD